MRRFLGFVLILVSGILSATPTDVSAKLQHILATSTLTEIGDIHGSAEPVQLLMRLLEDPQTGNHVDDIVVEFGNQRYQQQMDDYVLNPHSELTLDELRPAWRNTLYFMAWQYEHYPALVAKVAKYNRQYNHSIRLVLAEPAFQWDALTALRWRQLTVERKAGYQNIVEQQVLKRGRTAILLFGAFHMPRQPVLLKQQNTVVEVTPLLARFPRIKRSVIWPHMSNTHLDLPVPSLNNICEHTQLNTPLQDVSPRFAYHAKQKLGDITDYYFYTGPVLRAGKVSRDAVKDTLWHDEIMKRRTVVDTRVANQINHWLARYSKK